MGLSGTQAKSSLLETQRGGPYATASAERKSESEIFQSHVIIFPTKKLYISQGEGSALDCFCFRLSIWQSAVHTVSAL